MKDIFSTFSDDELVSYQASVIVIGDKTFTLNRSIRWICVAIKVDSPIVYDLSRLFRRKSVKICKTYSMIYF